MSNRVRSRLTYANVMATAAMFLALGGGAVWAASELGRNDVTAKNLAPKSVGGSELKPNAAKGADVKESSLDTVPRASSADNAAALDGFDAGALIRTASDSTANAGNADGTAATTTIQAPGPGFLTIFATADFTYGASGDQVECALEIDEVEVPDSSRVTNVSGVAEVDSDCATNATRQVAGGSHKVDLELAQLDDASVGAAGLSVIFTPFGAAG